MPPKSAPLTQVVVRRMIKESVDAAITVERARHANSGNDARESRFNELALMYPRMVEPESVKVEAYIRGLTDNIKGEVTSSKPANLNEAMRMAHKLMEQKSQARDERILEGKKRKWESFQSGNSSGNARAMTTAPTNGKVSSGSLPVCERCFTRHVGQCTIKYHKCGKVGHKARSYEENDARSLSKEEMGEVRGRAYAIKDAEPQGPNVVTGMLLLNNHYASFLFDLGSNRSFVDTRFSSMLNIEPVKIRASYEVELVNGRIHDAVIVCGEKVVRIPYGNKMQIVKSDKGVSRLKVISYIKARKYIERGCHLFLAHVTEKKSKKKRLEDVPVILPRAAPVARAPYRLAPSKMRELSVQLQKLLEKGFIRPSSSPWISVDPNE
ncbi:hypothetical protein Tco_0373099 [Tanacetum coccineum]